MNSLLGRGVVTYLALTLFFRLVSHIMQSEGSNHPHNPTWLLISFLNKIFSYGLLIALTTVGAVFLSFYLGGIIEKLKEAKTQKIEEQELQQRRYEDELLRKQEALERQRRIQKEKEEQEKEIVETQKRALKKRQARTAKDAAQSALDSFIN